MKGTIMASHLSLVQYVPDAATNERINIGVIAMGDGRARSLFLQNWARVRQFAGKEVTFLKELERDARHWDEATIHRLASQWTGSIQFTKPAFSMLTADELLLDGARRYLIEQSTAERGYRAKADAVRIVKARVKQALVDRLGGYARALIKDRSYETPGKHLKYEFDVSVANGHTLFAAQGLSFEVPATRRLEKEISATAWLIEDVKSAQPDVPIGVAVLPPKRALDDTFAKATTLYQQLGAEVLTEGDQLSRWAERMVDQLPPEVRRRK
jgi:hypothetical protein